MSAGPKMRCRKCGDIIQSMHRHDFRWCKCGAVAVDGGSEYLRVAGDLHAIETEDGKGLFDEQTDGPGKPVRDRPEGG